MARLFNAYVMVDWSGSSVPKKGADSIWIGVLKRDIRFQPIFESFNPATRAEAEAQLRTVLADLRRRNDRALIGFDFPLGYPTGFAAALKLEGDQPWRAIWSYLQAHVVDKKDNVNNRATVAARFNRLISNGPRPFWGTPRAADATSTLSKTKPADHLAGMREFRHAELATRGKGKGGAKTVWQLTGNGSVGSQALLGIPAVARLKAELGDKVLVWPFESGWRALTPSDLEGRECVLAEIYPSLVKAEPLAGEIADAAQVRSLAYHFARLDEQGKLAALFGPDKAVTPEMRDEVQHEEGWILGA